MYVYKLHPMQHNICIQNYVVDSALQNITPDVSSSILHKHDHSQELFLSFISTNKNEQYRFP